MKKTIVQILIATSFLLSCGPSRQEIETQELFKQQLIELKAKLAGEESKMASIQQWQLGRTTDEKAQQIEDQTAVIELLKSQISDTEGKIKQ